MGLYPLMRMEGWISKDANHTGFLITSHHNAVSVCLQLMLWLN
jgi:hypothetical protein